MKNAILSIFFVLLITLSAFSADQKHRETAYKLFEVMKMEQMLDESMEEMMKIQIAQAPQLAVYQDVMMGFLKKHMSWESLKEEYVDIYVEAYTRKEIKALIRFYKTKVGQKSIELTPKLTAQGALIAQNRVLQNQLELQQLIQEEAQRLGNQ